MSELLVTVNALEGGWVVLAEAKVEMGMLSFGNMWPFICFSRGVLLPVRTRSTTHTAAASIHRHAHRDAPACGSGPLACAPLRPIRARRRGRCSLRWLDLLVRARGKIEQERTWWWFVGDFRLEGFFLFGKEMDLVVEAENRGNPNHY